MGALALVNRLPPGVEPFETSTSPVNSKNHGHFETGLTSLEQTVRWLISRITTLIDEEDYKDAMEHDGGGGQYDDESDLETDGGSIISDQTSSTAEPRPSSQSTVDTVSSVATTPEKSFAKLGSRPSADTVETHALVQPSPDMVPLVTSPFDPFHSQWAGFNGRPNKIADTCYGFWVGGSLAVRALPGIPSRRLLYANDQT